MPDITIHPVSVDMDNLVTAIARLIASAPDLLTALENLSEWGRAHTSPADANSPHDLLVAAVAAIEKAGGTIR